jgi:hypothetical protein
MASALAASACTSVPKIDGSSDVAFDSSHARLVESLTPEERLRLILAEGIVLAPLGCLTLEPIPDQQTLTDTLGGQSVLRSCRHELDGMTFESIMSRAYPAGVPGR